MKRLLLLLNLLAFAFAVSDAQSTVLKGRITNQTGAPVPYATVYIQELRQGTTSNTRGDYEIRLPEGSYQVIWQSLGYSPVIYQINIAGSPVIRDVVLPLQYYEIPEVRIMASGEDPAYRIMRKAIGMAPYYQNNISYYKAEVYLKGNLEINKIPKLFQRAINAEAKREEGGSISSNKIKEGDVYMMESLNEMEFTAPDKYVQKVISVQSTFPDEGDDISPMDYISASFYQPLVAELAISPLSPQAFSYYRFKYLGASPQGNNVVNKIEVIPKIKSQQLFEGTIFIIENLWCLHSVDLTNENIAGKISVQQIYIPVQDDIWMPVSHNFKINFSMIGIKADAGYGASIKYLEVKPNASLERPASLTAVFYGQATSGTPDPEIPASKNQEKIEKILEKDEISNRDMVVLSKLLNKESEKSRPDSVRINLEVKDNTTTIIDKGAHKRDSTYWADIRPVPLSETEMQSIRIRDSLRAGSSLRNIKTDTAITVSGKKKSKFFRTINEITFGHTWSDTNGLSFNYGGLADIRNLSFNSVDGFVYGQDFRLSKRWKDKSSLTLAPELNWAFNREKLMWRIHGNYVLDRIKQKEIFLRTGIISRDIATGGSINPFLNSVTSLFFKKNYLKLYETQYITFGYRNVVTNGMIVELSAGYNNRRVLENNTNFSFLRSSEEYQANIPPSVYLDTLANPLYSLKDQQHYAFTATITYTPRQRFRIYNGARIPLDSDWPTFSFTWKHGVNEFAGESDRWRHFDQASFDISQKYEPGGFSEFRWSIKTGSFIGSRHVTYFDFFHFNTQPLPLLLGEYEDAFRLPAYYSLSTPDFFAEAHLKYTTPYLLLKYLPGLSKTLMRENLSFSYLGSQFHRNYMELGYSVSEFLLLGEVGIYAGFEDLKYRNIGARLILKFN